MPVTEVSRRASARTARASAPPSAAHAGFTPTNEVTANPASVAATTASGRAQSRC